MTAALERFTTRLLEIHSVYALDYDWVIMALRFARDHGMTGLVFHRNDVVDLVTYPAGIFDHGEHRNILEQYSRIYPSLYKYISNGRSTPAQRREYFGRIIDIAAEWGLQVWFENKEIWFHDALVELRPHVMKNGAICPSEPMWWDYVREKYRMLYRDLPKLAGVINSPASAESKVSIAGNRCTCELCQQMTPDRWYRSLLMSMHESITAGGGKLVVRDFVFDKKNQSEIAPVMEALPADVAISLKNTPHDYYPTFPDNPRLGGFAGKEKWLEYDAMGQYFGWGIGIAHLADDIRGRLERAADKGVTGLLLRSCWEGLEAHTAFHTPNKLNLHAAARLARDASADNDSIYREWLKEGGRLEPNASEADIDATVAWARRVLGRSWEVVSKTLFVNDCVFSDSSCYPVSLDHAWWLGEEKNSLRDWDPSKWDAMRPDEANVHQIIAEKDAALTLVEELCEQAGVRPKGLSDAGYAAFIKEMEAFRQYVRGYRLIGQTTVLAKFILEGIPLPNSTFGSEASRLFDQKMVEMLELAGEFHRFRETTDYRYPVYMLVAGGRLEVLHADLTDRVYNRKVALAG